MKTIHKISFVLCTLCLCTLFLGCNKKSSPFDVSGDCRIDSLVLDTYPGKVDHAARTVVVAVPEVHDDHLMTLTTLRLSAGATASLREGDQVNMTSPIAIHVENGNVYQDYKVSVKHDEARILSFVLNENYIGIIDQVARTISVSVPIGTDVKALVPTVKTTAGATLTPANGVPCDFSNPVDFTVKYNTASATYKVTVTEKANPVVLYLGLAETVGQLNPEEQAAVTWMLSNVEKSDYASFADLAAGRVVMTDCKVIWWHFHKDGGMQGKEAFEANAPEAVDVFALDKLKEFYQSGGSFLLTRYAVNLPFYLGEKECFPNNAWGGKESEAELVSSPWEFAITGHTDHALWQNLTMDPTVSDHVYTCDAGYKITNSTAQYHIGTDWGGYDDRTVFQEKTGAKDIAGGADAVVAWEFPRSDAHGAIICIGSGCYDWYTIADPADYTEYYHANVAKITENAFNYLKN
ncbi:MAG: DUF4960 domain-containing protein [Paludibacteraceae bacterium]|nr:DUF4960 domain-containing protein [Paludibacteraceae bacterium]